MTRRKARFTRDASTFALKLVRARSTDAARESPLGDHARKDQSTVQRRLDERALRFASARARARPCM